MSSCGSVRLPDSPLQSSGQGIRIGGARIYRVDCPADRWGGTPSQVVCSHATARLRLRSGARSAHTAGLARSMGAVAGIGLGSPSANSRSRVRKRPCGIAPVFRPEVRRGPRREMSRANMLCWMAHRGHTHAAMTTTPSAPLEVQVAANSRGIAEVHGMTDPFWPP